jgi:quinol monooxygenase YgiN
MALVTHSPDELKKADADAFPHLEAAPECISYELSQCDEAPQSFILRIEWTSVDAQMNGFRGGPHFPPFLSAIRAFIPEIAEMRHYTVLCSSKRA